MSQGSQRGSRRRPFPGMWSAGRRRILSLFLLLLTVFYLAESAHDVCDRNPHEAPVVCHLACLDDCGATFPMPYLVPPPPDPLPKAVFQTPEPLPPLSRTPEPEETPPKQV